MSQPTYLQQPAIVSLRALLQQVARGEIQIPRFQRKYVWSNAQRLLLFQSIYQRIPIGSILVWRTQNHDLQTFARLGELSIAPPQAHKKGAIKQYLLDGYQRVCTLYMSLGPGLLTRMEPEDAGESSWSTIEQVEFSEDLPPIYFDLENEEFGLKSRRAASPPACLPLSILFDPYELHRFQDNLATKAEGRKLMNRAEKLADDFKDYNIPIVPVASEDIEVVTESFQRVNSAGTKMDLVNMVNALLWSPEFDLNDRIAEIKDRLAAVGWSDFEEKHILDACKVALNLNIYGADVKETKEALLERVGILDDIARSLEAVALFLREQCNILSPKTLPYNYHAILLAGAIDITEDLSTATALERWVWMTTYSEYFAGINSSRLRRTVEHVRLIANEGADPKPPDLTPEVAPQKRFDFRTARSRAILLRMGDLDPQGPSGESQEPFRLLAEYGKDAAPMLVPSREVGNRETAEGVENRLIVHPGDAAALRHVLLSGEAEAENLQSHAIDEDAAAALRVGNLPRFFSLRRSRLLDLERQAVEALGLTYGSDFE